MFRVLTKSPAYTTVAVATLALGIGANTAIFSVADAFLWKPLSLPGEDRLAFLMETAPDGERDLAAPATFLDWRAHTSSFEGLAACLWLNLTLSDAGRDGWPERVESSLVTANFFDTLGIRPALGRTFASEEGQPGHDRVVILTHRLWQKRFAGDPAVLGHTVKLDGRTVAIVGVMPPRFEFPLGTDLWMPLAWTPQQRESRTERDLVVVGRLKPGVSRTQAQADVQLVTRRIAEQNLKTNRGWSADVLASREFVVSGMSIQYTWMSLGAVAFVLLIACANVANLQLARATQRRKEIALRTALGASRWRIARQLLGESIVVSLLGAGAGLLLAVWCVDLIRAGMPPEVEPFVANWKEIHVDVRALAFTLAVAVAAGILAGLAPVFQAAGRVNLNDALKETGRTAPGSRRHHRVRSLLVVAEMALALVLLVGAGLMVSGFSRLIQSGRTISPETLLTLRVALPDATYRAPHQVASYYDRALAGVRSLPGVESAALAARLPHSPNSLWRYFSIEGRPEPEQLPSCVLQPVTPNYFRTLRIPLRVGRELTPQDGPDSQRVAVISQAFANRHFPGQNPIGRRIKLGVTASPGPWMTVVGVAGDVAHNAYDRAPRSVLYVPFAQMPMPMMEFAVRTEGDPLRLAPAALASIQQVDREVPVYDVQTMQKLIDNEVVGLRYVAALMGIFGVLALVLSSVGVYAVMAYSVSERTHEIGLRMALGADRRSVIAAVLRRGMAISLAGMAIGLGMAFGLARLLASLFLGISSTDPVAFAGFSTVLALVALAACYIPARRAAAVDPIRALRHE